MEELLSSSHSQCCLLFLFKKMDSDEETPTISKGEEEIPQRTTVVGKSEKFNHYRALFPPDRHGFFLVKRRGVRPPMASERTNPKQSQFYDRGHVGRIFEAFLQAGSTNTPPQPPSKDIVSKVTNIELVKRYPIFYRYDQLTYRAEIEYGRKCPPGKPSFSYMDIRLPNDGFLYDDLKDSEVFRDIKGLYHHIEGWQVVELRVLQHDFPHLLRFAKRWFSCDISVQMYYHSEMERIDFLFRPRCNADINLKICFEPGFPEDEIREDLWQDVPPDE